MLNFLFPSSMVPPFPASLPTPFPFLFFFYSFFFSTHSFPSFHHYTFLHYSIYYITLHPFTILFTTLKHTIFPSPHFLIYSLHQLTLLHSLPIQAFLFPFLPLKSTLFSCFLNPIHIHIQYHSYKIPFTSNIIHIQYHSHTIPFTYNTIHIKYHSLPISFI